MFHLHAANVVQIIFVVQCLFGSLLLMGQSRFRVLVWLLLGNALLMSLNLVEEKGLTRQLHVITPVFSLVWGPLFWLFVTSLLQGERPSRPWLHFLPAVVALPFTAAGQVVLALGALSQVLYACCIVALLLRYQKVTQEVRSDAADFSLRWLMFVLGTFGALALIDGVRHSLQPYLSLGVAQPWYTAMLASHLVVITYLVIKAVRQPALYANLAHYRDIVQAPAPAANDVHAEQIFAFIRQHIEQTQLYQRERLSLRQVAEETGLLERDISRAINTVGQLSFNDFINGYRIEEVKARLGEPGDQSILDIALAAGFSSKSSFNPTFKRVTGVTPSQYVALLERTPSSQPI